MTRILVTGGTGFLGTHLCERLRERGDAPVALGSRDCDLTRQGSLDALPAQRWDVIYHLAAWTQAGDFCLRHPGEQWVINQQINTQVLEWWQRAQPQAKLVFMGTSCAYAPEMPLVEANYMVGEPIESLYTYAMTKRMLLQGARALAAQYGLRYLCLVPSTLYGPGYHVDGRQMHFIFDLIRKILRGKDLGEPVVLWGDGHQRREVVFIDDFVDATLALAPRVDNELVNLGAGREHSIREFVDAICRVVGYDAAQVQYDTSRYVGARSKFLDTAKVQGLLPGFPGTGLDEGLRRTIAWFREQRIHLR
ncbi:NAD-dependent epimerase/dehydratase family protein [Ramlibacter sp. PS4R-6]|uniref:NAD-dependent epimerase/dehydratase family protein n=1 Tax=Ramlibacter sp. PS4R-6 TaxID=3133438 RepID=UPI0030ABC0B1